MCGHKMVRLCFSIKIQTKLKFIIVNFWGFFGDEPDQLSVGSTVLLLRSFLLVFVTSCFFTS